MTKQLVNRNRDVVGTNCVKDNDGKIVVEADRLMKVWRSHYEGRSISFEPDLLK